MTTVATCLLATNAFAGGAVDKVTGDFTQGNCWGCVPGDELGFVAHRLISAKEATSKHPQRGFLFSWGDNGSWWEMDFSDPAETCVHVYADGQVRMGGLVSDGRNQVGNLAPQIGRYFGVYLVDGGEPAYFMDHGVVYRFSSDYWSADAREQFFHWCDTGNLPEGNDLLPGAAEWPNVVFQGNLQIHNSSRDGD
jgi:hypothetical protein